MNCTKCGSEMDTATVSGGGYVAWFCHECMVIKPAEGVSMMRS